MPRSRSILPLLLALLPLPASAAATAPTQPAVRQPAAVASPQLTPCKVPGERGEVDARCGLFAVYENRAARSGRKIHLKVVVLPALSAHPKPDPIFFFGGGPGEAIAGEAGGAADDPLRQDRDLVFVDQRGTGEPDRLGCNLGGRDDDLQSYLGEMFPVAAVRQCRDELAKRADLTLYTTDVAMDDIDDARAWLGYGRINLNGGSYGTRAAQVFLRRHPRSVRTVILNGVVAMDETLPISHAAAGQRSLDLLLGWCDADAACHQAFPDVHRELKAVLDRLAKAPVEVEIRNPATGKKAGYGPDKHLPVKVSAREEMIADGIRWQLYTPRTGAALPALIHNAYLGHYEPLAEAAVGSRLTIIQVLAFGMFFSVTCAEDIPFIDPSQVAARTAGSFLGDYRVRQQTAACGVWPRAKVPPGHREAVHSDVPVLLINGERDPVTPPEFGDRAARFLTNSLHVVVPYGAHGGETPCVAKIQRDFLAQGTVRGLDTACLRDVKLEPFLLAPPKEPGSPLG